MGKLEFLAEHPLFRGLEENELQALSRIFQEYKFNDKSVIAFQRDVADKLYIVRNGRLYARQLDDRGLVRSAHTRDYTDGQFFGASWLFTPSTYPATIVGTTEGRLLILSSQDFLEFLKQYPAALNRMEPDFDEEDGHHLGLPQEAWDEASKLSLKDRRKRIGPVRLLPDEKVEYYSRRSIWYLFVQLFLPGLFIIVLPLLVYFLLPVDSLISQILRWIGIGIPVLILGFIIVFRLLDWTNDFFVITNKHISQREFELRGFRTQLIKVPIEQVQSVSIVKPNFTANLFNIGTARITTAAQIGTILFDNIDKPIEVKDTLERLRRQVQAYDAALAQTKMRQSMEAHFGLGPGYEKIPNEEEPVPESIVSRTRVSLWGYILNIFDWRVVDGVVITYRKNLLVLLWDLLWPMLGFILQGVIMWMVINFGGISPTTVLLFFSLTLLLNLFWLIWMYEDWRNDIYQLSDLYVIDIDRKPFGFGESRKQAPLRNIQNVNAERPGFWATLFDYGYLHIETAGAESDIVFERIPRPSQVLSEIFDRLDAVRKGERRREGKDRREEYALLLDVYKQEMELGRIPRRTPPEE